MPREKRPKARSMESLRHAEYYDMQRTFDELYARSQAGEIFDDLMDLILSKENIMLAYRNIKANSGSATPGTDRLRITDIGRLSADEVVARVRKIVNGGRNGYTPRSVRRKEIPKPNGKTRPLGIPCIWDRLIQQCIKQVMEPVCEAKFSSNSYGFRPNRSVENAIAAMYRLMQRSGLYYVVEFDIKGFFDNVDHTKLIRQLWSLNIRDKKLLHVIRRILKAPIQMPDGHLENPKKGTPQGGIISPLLANVVLNELDHWVESQWQNHPVIEKYSYRENAAGCPIHSHAYRAMRNTNLKEKFIVRKRGVAVDNILNTITAYREERKWSLYDLATHAELKTSTISTWYNNNAIPTIPSLVKICDAFQITLSEFFAKAEGSESVPVALTPQQMQIIEKWSILRPDQQEAVLNLLNTIP